MLPPNLVARWTAQEDYHLTLNFLGDLAQTMQPRLIKAAAGIPKKFSPFTIHISFSEAFDSARQPSVLWAGLNDKRLTTQLSKSLDSALAAQGIAIKPHSFVPHITLGRCRAKDPDHPPPPIKTGLPINLEMPVDGFALMCARTPNERRNNPEFRYNIVHTFPFTG